MSQFNEIIKLACLISIISGILLSLVPKSKIRSTYKMLIVILMLYAVITPFAKFKVSDLNFDELFYMENKLEQEYSERNNRLILSTSETEIEKVLIQKLDECNIEYNSINVSCTIENGNIKVENIEILGSFTNSEKEKISQIIKENIDDTEDFGF